MNTKQQKCGGFCYKRPKNDMEINLAFLMERVQQEDNPEEAKVI